MTIWSRQEPIMGAKVVRRYTYDEQWGVIVEIHDGMYAVQFQESMFYNACVEIFRIGKFYRNYTMEVVIEYDDVDVI